MSSSNNSSCSLSLPKRIYEAISLVEGEEKTRRWVHSSVSPELLAQATRAREQYLNFRDGPEMKSDTPIAKINSKLESGCYTFSTGALCGKAADAASRRIRWEFPCGETLPQLSVRMPFEPHGTRVFHTGVPLSHLANSVVDHLYESDVCIISIGDEGLNCISPDGLVHFVVSLIERPNLSSGTAIKVGHKRSMCKDDEISSVTRNILMEVRRLSGTSFEYLELVEGIFRVASAVADCRTLSPSKEAERSIKRASLPPTSLEHPPIRSLVRHFAPCLENDKSPSSEMIHSLQKCANFSNFGLPFLQMVCFYTDSSKVGPKAFANAVDILDKMGSVMENRIETLSSRPSELRTRALVAFQSILNCIQTAPAHVPCKKFEFGKAMYKSLLKIVSNSDTQAYDAMISLKCLNILLSISNLSQVISRVYFEGIVRDAVEIGAMRYHPLQEEAKRFLLAI